MRTFFKIILYEVCKQEGEIIIFLKFNGKSVTHLRTQVIRLVKATFFQVPWTKFHKGENRVHM